MVEFFAEIEVEVSYVAAEWRGNYCLISFAAQVQSTVDYSDQNRHYTQILKVKT